MNAPEYQQAAIRSVVEEAFCIACTLLVDDAQVLPALQRDVAVLMLTHVNYRTGEMLDMRAITQAAHEAGALVIWDLCHSAGAIHRRQRSPSRQSAALRTCH